MMRISVQPFCLQIYNILTRTSTFIRYNTNECRAEDFPKVLGEKLDKCQNFLKCIVSQLAARKYTPPNFKGGVTFSSTSILAGEGVYYCQRGY